MWIGQFANATRDSDDRLLSRRIFRKNERGEENGIPSYEKRLYNRHLERDVSETLRTSEFQAKVYGYDMSSLYKRSISTGALRERQN